MSATPAFKIDWSAGASAAVEIASAGKNPGEEYQVRFTPSLRPTLRPRPDIRWGREQLEPVQGLMEQALGVRAAPSRDSTGSPQPATSKAPVSVQLKDVGEMLIALALNDPVCSELRPPGVYLEIGMDEDLLEYPWELLHDGDNFYCLKHCLGRFVNVSQPLPPSMKPAGDAWGGRLDPLSVLVVSVSKPRPLGKLNFRPLRFAYQETMDVLTTLGKVRGVKVKELRDEDATFDAVRRELWNGKYQIFHFIGHAYFDPNDPRQSGLVLQDRIMQTGQLHSFLGKTRPVLCFINACESTRVFHLRESFNSYGLARAILEAGAYLLGSRWKIADDPASRFAPPFYQALLGEGKPMGQAVLLARKEVYREDVPDDFAWASYVFYGDPRVCFQTY